MSTRLVIMALFASILRCQTVPSSAGRWQVETLALKPDSGGQRGDLTATILNQLSGQRTELSGRVPLDRVDESFVNHDKLVIIGEAHKPQAVVIIDIPRHQVIDSFFCYGPKRISENLIAFVEFYFPHVAGGEPTDVVLIYDLSKSPVENRLEKAPGMSLPPSDLDPAAVHVGIPVFPDWNASNKSYNNIATGPANARSVLGQGGFVLVGTNTLVFVASEDEAFPDKHNYLVAVDLSNGLSRTTVRQIVIPAYRLPRMGRFPNFTVITKLEAASPTSVRLRVPEGDYGVGSLNVDIQ